MVAAPITSNKIDSSISPLFGKAKYFAFWDGDKLKVQENRFKSGSEVIEWLYLNGVKNIIIKEIGSSPYVMAKEAGIKLFFAGDSRIEAIDAFMKFDKNELKELTKDEISNIIKHHEHKHHGFSYK